MMALENEDKNRIELSLKHLPYLIRQNLPDLHF